MNKNINSLAVKESKRQHVREAEEKRICFIQFIYYCLI